MRWDDVRRLSARGAAIGSHSVSHAHLPQLETAEVQRDLRESKNRIEEELGRPCPDFAYPYGQRDARVRELVRAAGYERAFALGTEWGDPYDMPRVDLYRRHGVVKTLLKAKLPYRVRAALRNA
jgi:peptidoglycan/xylan/chitin deacetylase (PgdA/CDA1 family)